MLFCQISYLISRISFVQKAQAIGEPREAISSKNQVFQQHWLHQVIFHGKQKPRYMLNQPALGVW